MINISRQYIFHNCPCMFLNLILCIKEFNKNISFYLHSAVSVIRKSQIVTVNQITKKKHGLQSVFILNKLLISGFH